MLFNIRFEGNIPQTIREGNLYYLLSRIVLGQMHAGGALLGLPYCSYKTHHLDDDLVEIIFSDDRPYRAERIDVNKIDSCIQSLKLRLDSIDNEEKNSQIRRTLQIRIKNLESIKDIVLRDGFLKTPLYGQFLLDPKPRIDLFWGNLKQDKEPELALVATMVHESFHAWNFFCSGFQGRTIPEIDEAIVEYSTLSFLERLSLAENIDVGIWRPFFGTVYEWQKKSVHQKKDGVGLSAAYGFGEFIFSADSKKELMRVYPIISGRLSPNESDIIQAVSLLNPIYPEYREQETLALIIQALNKKIITEKKISI